MREARTDTMAMALLCGLWACDSSAPALAGAKASGDAVQPVASLTVEVGPAAQVVPGAGLPAEVSPQNSNNNLDIARDGQRLFLAARTAPDHFASPQARIYVVSAEGQQPWQFETSVQLGSDVREPRLLAFGGKIRLFVAQLGDNPGSFDPKGTFVSVRSAPGQWSPLQPFYQPGFIPWRVHVWSGKAWLIGYTGGDGVYQIDKPAIAVHLLQSSDGESWQPAVPGQPVVLEGGVSEAGVAQLDDGSFVLVGRNERGEPGFGYGSKICRGAGQLPWACRGDKRKFDSPLLFRVGQRLVLVARRSLDASGQTADYDLGERGMAPSARYLKYQGAYWVTRKRCAVWEVNPQDLEVTWLADLPSRGDTCFASVVPEDPAATAATARRWLVYNYSSPLDGDADPPWYQGQLGETRIYRQTLEFGVP